MQKIHFSIHINAPKEKVWEIMLDDVIYREWTLPFNESGSYYVGDWSEGSKMIFLGPDPEKGVGGMVSRIKENRPYEFMSIEHVGEISNGVEDTESEAVQKWKGAHENYTFEDEEGGTKLTIDLDMTEEFKDYMEAAWPKALEILKELAEK
jgi:hypothetical protein